MKWIKKDIWGEEKTWYSKDIIDRIKQCAQKVVDMNRCKGCRYENFCEFEQCGTYQARKILDIIESEDR